MKGSFALWVENAYERDVLFECDKEDYIKDRLPAFPALRKAFDKVGWRCHTQDVYIANGVAPDIVLFLNFPANREWHNFKELGWKAQSWVFLQECEVVIPTNWDIDKHTWFDKIFTWHDSYVDNEKYIKTNFSHLFPLEVPIRVDKPKFCTMIIGNKSASHPQELYSERVKTIKWFEKYHPDEFEFYGVGWDKPTVVINQPRLYGMLTRLLNRTPSHPTYRGIVADKNQTYQEYKFAICYENAQGIPGYITEKIFDCFFAGCVPVYWGAPNVTEHIPESCFIDRRRFVSLDELYKYLISMSDAEYSNFLANINDFLQSDKAMQFKSAVFAETIVRQAVSGKLDERLI